MPPTVITTKNLGFIKAIHKGVNPPLNTAIIWYDDNIGQKIHKYYDVTLAVWVPFAAGTTVISASSYGQMRHIPNTTTVDVLADFQYWIYGDLSIEGTLNNHGEVIVANGSLVLSGGGTFNNIGAGTITLLNLSTGENMYVIKVPLTSLQMRTGNSIPLDALVAPGLSKTIEVIASSFEYTANDGLLTCGGGFRLITETCADHQAQFVFDSSIDGFTKGVLSSSAQNQLAENKKLQIVFFGDGVAGVGTGTGNVYITYKLTKN